MIGYPLMTSRMWDLQQDNMSNMESDGECSGSEEENANDELYDGGGSQDSNVELGDAVALQEWR